MRDKLTKKRIRIDYALVLEVAGLSSMFMRWQQLRRSKVSFNRQARAFCLSHKVDVDSIYQSCLDKGYRTYDDYQKELIRLASDHSWIED